MNVLIAGASGLLGSALVDSLKQDAHSVRRLTRSRSSLQADEATWNPAEGRMDTSALQGVDAVVCLSGESIASGRWTLKKKRAIRDSRVASVGLLCKTMASINHSPRVLVCASAIGYYGDDRGDTILTEESPAGDGFLAEVCKDWEHAAEPAQEHGIRVVHARFAAILSSKGGALAKMLPIFKFGLGGTLGSGAQYFSWVTLDDAVGMIEFAIAHERLRGPINCVSPNPVTNRDFTKTLGKVLRRPAILPVPAIALRTALGEVADALLLSSLRVVPRELEKAEYSFKYPDLEEALRHVIQN